MTKSLTGARPTNGHSGLWRGLNSRHSTIFFILAAGLVEQLQSLFAELELHAARETFKLLNRGG